MIIVGVGRDREDLLLRQLGRAPARFRLAARPRLERRQILTQRIVVHRRVLERRAQLDWTAEQGGGREEIDETDKRDVVSVGFHEMPQTQARANKRLRRDGNWLRRGLHWRRFAAGDEIGEVAPENTQPRLQFVMQSRRFSPFGFLLGLRRRYFGHPPLPWYA